MTRLWQFTNNRKHFNHFGISCAQTRDTDRQVELPKYSVIRLGRFLETKIKT